MDVIPTIAGIGVVGVLGYFAVSIILYSSKQKKESKQEAWVFEEPELPVDVQGVAPMLEEVRHGLEVTRARTGEDTQVDLAPLIDLLALWEGRRYALPYDGQQAYYTAHEECRIELANAIFDLLEKTNDR